MLRADYTRRDLVFNFEAITSRQTMKVKETYFLRVWDDRNPQRRGVGECAIFRGLSSDDTPFYESRIADLCRSIDSVRLSDIRESSLRFGFETAMADLRADAPFDLWPGAWSRGEQGLEINGLVWMGDYPTMQRRIDEKIAAGFRCIKIKIGSLDFDRELSLLDYIREQHDVNTVELRLDANGAFSPKEALRKIERLARYDIHSIEQPVRAAQWQAMREITRNSPIPVALDEELIGSLDYDRRCRLLDATMPAYVIIKPSLCGGFAYADGWIRDAGEREIGWWATSALESNVGLNAIARWVAAKSPDMPQGLGTGALYTNNVPSPLHVKGSRLYYNTDAAWDLNF